MAYSKQTWDTTSYVNPTRMNHIEQGIESVEQEIPEIADNLTTDDSTKALSAKQGKVLNEKTADDIEYSTGVSVKDKIDNLSRTSVTSIQFTNSKCNPVYPIDCRRNGNVVNISTIINPTSTIATNEILATLPEGYRPSNNFAYFTASHDVVVQARTNGEFKVSDISATVQSPGYYGVNLTFVV